MEELRAPRGGRARRRGANRQRLRRSPHQGAGPCGGVPEARRRSRAAERRAVGAVPGCAARERPARRRRRAARHARREARCRAAVPARARRLGAAHRDHQGVLGPRALRARSVPRRARVADGCPSARRARRLAPCVSSTSASPLPSASSAKVQPPPEVAAAHSTLVAAAGMAVRAATSRLDAVRSGNMDTAWEASSAAAGSLLMLDQAIAELRRITHAPQPGR